MSEILISNEMYLYRFSNYSSIKGFKIKIFNDYISFKFKCNNETSQKLIGKYSCILSHKGLYEILLQSFRSRQDKSAKVKIDFITHDFNIKNCNEENVQKQLTAKVVVKNKYLNDMLFILQFEKREFVRKEKGEKSVGLVRKIEKLHEELKSEKKLRKDYQKIILKQLNIIDSQKKEILKLHNIVKKYVSNEEIKSICVDSNSYPDFNINPYIGLNVEINDSIYGKAVVKNGRVKMKKIFESKVNGKWVNFRIEKVFKNGVNKVKLKCLTENDFVGSYVGIYNPEKVNVKKKHTYLGSSGINTSRSVCLQDGFIYENSKKLKKYFKEMVKNKDELEVIIDYERKEVSFKKNGEKIGVCFNNVKPPLRIGVTIFYKYQSFVVL